MKTSSAKNKGRRFQQYVRDLILNAFPVLQPDDVRSTGMGQGGADLQLSPRAHELFPYQIECKNQERVQLWKAWDQAKENSGEYTPLLFITRNRSDELVVMKAEHFMKIITPLNGGNL
jgi:hypothetical protein